MGLEVGDVVTRTGADKLRIIALYEGCDEIVVECLVGETWADIGAVFDILSQSVELVHKAGCVPTYDPTTQPYDEPFRHVDPDDDF